MKTEQEVRRMEKVDDTINAICNWIQKELKESDCEVSNRVPPMASALAELVVARAAVIDF